MPSTVVIAALPTAEIGVTHERIGSPSMWTVQAPQKPAPQPNFGPFRSSSSRRTHSSGIWASTSTERVRPLTLILNAMPTPSASAILVD